MKPAKLALVSRTEAGYLLRLPSFCSVMSANPAKSAVVMAAQYGSWLSFLLTRWLASEFEEEPWKYADIKELLGKLLPLRDPAVLRFAGTLRRSQTTVELSDFTSWSETVAS